MAGLDGSILEAIDADSVLEHIKFDVRTDFIFAPHLDAIFSEAGIEVWHRSVELLRSGRYEPGLPFTMSVPKGRGYTRPGTILSPVDRFVYQALINLVTPVLDDQLDRSRVFSYPILPFDRNPSQSAHECWLSFQNVIRDLCSAGEYIMKADIANYFERIPQHHLVNLMRAAGCLPEAVNLLEEMLLAFRGRNSFGIVQGVFPSDVLGDFYLSDLDAYFELTQVRSARYNDDIYLQYGTRLEAQRGLVTLIERLRKNGLHLNEFKSGIQDAHDIIREETEVESLFKAAREEIRDELVLQFSGYGFSADWEIDEETDEVIRLEAVERLYKAIEEYPEQAEKIEKFCLPVLRSARSTSAIDSVLNRLIQNGHLARLYHSYLSRFVYDQPELGKELEKIVLGDDLVTDYEKMFLLSSLFNTKKAKYNTINRTLLWLTSTNQTAEETRAIAAIFAAKHGNANQKRAVLLAYEDEPSEYVRSAILFSSQFMTSVEKKTCIRAWGGHSMLNTLTAQAM